VRIDHLLLKKDDGKERKPLVVVHGMMSSKLSFKPLFDQEEILEKRDCYLVDLRNGEYSDWHDEISYELQAEDIIRWADKNGI
jgi:pimeloyl-ACP methyl ester carboxylesterase